MYGILISVSIAVESSCFARSAASFKRWTASASFEISMPSCFLYSPNEIFLDLFVEVIAAKMRVAARRANFNRLLFVSAS